MCAGIDGRRLVRAGLRLGLGLRVGGQLGKKRGELSRIDDTGIGQEFQFLYVACQLRCSASRAP
jgi:hypothetical protein